MGKNKKKGNRVNKASHDNGEVSKEKINSDDIPKVVEQTVVEDEINVTVDSVVSDKEDEEVARLREELARLKLQLQASAQDGNEDERLARVKEERDHFETQYNTLLSRLSSMKSLFSKMKESQLELETTQEQLAEYESQNLKLKNKIDSLMRENEEYKSTVVTLNREVASLNTECENLSSECLLYKEQVERARDEIEMSSSLHSKDLYEKIQEIKVLQSKMQELNIIIETNKQDTSSMEEQLQDYEQQVEQLQEDISKQQNVVAQLEEQLEKATIAQEQEKSRTGAEIKILKHTIEELNGKSSADAKTIAEMNAHIESIKEDVEIKKKLEKECKERVLQIGKLRHEAIILNEHLTKALAMIKSSNDSESVDKELISNLFISFVSIPRGDPKKFEVLELISNFLNWDDDKKTQAGLIYNTADLPNGTRNDSFVSLWAEFLERGSEK
ncbi:Rud3p Ecym_8321 [Eremothecium cymbalariae DBVPG|uniref:GRIP domain-containing protein n=1 Tax=Eremothecium cymbalariae (strain CBS 270.75 / DBVPG 7215 / KCTC 17166 / NRRL Y-17582) TaxID=931890 RepID=G8JXM5_ERECY|nr:Hypothetical protein Ecym_8321 [Eremothecium cymbalariae DBVPG\